MVLVILDYEKLRYFWLGQAYMYMLDSHND